MNKQFEEHDHLMKLKSGVSVVIPVYNAEGTIEELTTRLHTVLPRLFTDYEIILINDGSHDYSWKSIQSLCQYPGVRGFNLMRNFGQHNALLCGIRNAKFETTITMDDDLQHPPEQLPLLVEEFKKGYDVVYAVPKKLPHAWWRNLGSKLTKFTLSKFMRIPIQEIGAFRIFRTDLRNAFANYQSPDVYIDPLLSWGTTNFGHVFVDEDQRKVGTSNYTFRKLVHAGLLILTGYSTIPLRLASTLGFIFMLVGILILFYVLFIKIVFDSVSGFPFLASIIALFSGVQLFTLGIIGEYLARMYDRSTDRPPFIVKDEITAKKDDLQS